MSNVIKLLAVISILFPSLSSLSSTEEVTVDRTRLVVIKGVIQTSLFKEANKMISLTKSSGKNNGKAKDEAKKPIYILINSPGGLVSGAHNFRLAMQMVKYRGVKIKCVVPFLVASMAFDILLECDERYVFRSTRLLFHPVRENFSFQFLNAKDLSSSSARLARADREIKDRILKYTGMSKEILDKTFYAEKWWSPAELSAHVKEDFLRVVTDVKGIDDLLFTEGKK